MLSVSTQIAVGDDILQFEKLLGSITFADEIVIFNMERNDKPALDLFTRFHARVINIKTPRVVEFIRSDQIKAAAGEWVLIMDYDEVVTPALSSEIKQITKEPTAEYAGYYISRRNYSLGYPLKRGGFGDDNVARLFDKKRFVSWSRDIHSLPQIDGNYGKLNNYMEHHKDASLAQMVAKTNRYSAIEAEQFLRGGLPTVTTLTLFRKPLMEFLRRYVFKLGILDGAIGLLQALYQSYSVFLAYAKLYELQTKKV